MKHGDATSRRPIPKLSILAIAFLAFLLTCKNCAPTAPSPPPFLDIGQMFLLPHSVSLGGPSAPQLGRTKQLLASSLSCCPRPRNTDAPEIQSCTCSSHAESRARPTCPDYFSSAGAKKIYFLVGNFCISCWRSVFVCLLEYPALPTLTGLPSTADCGKPHLHLNSLH